MDTEDMVVVSFPRGIFSGLGFQAVYKNKQAFGQTADEAVKAVAPDEHGQITIGIEWMTEIKEA